MGETSIFSGMLLLTGRLLAAGVLAYLIETTAGTELALVSRWQISEEGKAAGGESTRARRPEVRGSRQRRIVVAVPQDHKASLNLSPGRQRSNADRAFRSHFIYFGRIMARVMGRCCTVVWLGIWWGDINDGRGQLSLAAFLPRPPPRSRPAESELTICNSLIAVPNTDTYGRSGLQKYKDILAREFNIFRKFRHQKDFFLIWYILQHAPELLPPLLFILIFFIGPSAMSNPSIPSSARTPINAMIRCNIITPTQTLQS